MTKITKAQINESNKKHGIYENASYCTEQYHRVNRFAPSLVVTDGVIEAVKDLQAFWLTDIIASYVHRLARMDESFFSVRLLKNIDDNGALFTIEDGDYNILLSQQIEYTDCPKNVHWFMQKSDSLLVTMMPSEY